MAVKLDICESVGYESWEFLYSIGHCVIVLP